MEQHTAYSVARESAEREHREDVRESVGDAIEVEVQEQLDEDARKITIAFLELEEQTTAELEDRNA